MNIGNSQILSQTARSAIDPFCRGSSKDLHAFLFIDMRKLQ